jgi:hypothetical protein
MSSTTSRHVSRKYRMHEAIRTHGNEEACMEMKGFRAREKQMRPFYIIPSTHGSMQGIGHMETLLHRW